MFKKKSVKRLQFACQACEWCCNGAAALKRYSSCMKKKNLLGCKYKKMLLKHKKADVIMGGQRGGIANKHNSVLPLKVAVAQLG